MTLTSRSTGFLCPSVWRPEAGDGSELILMSLQLSVIPPVAGFSEFSWKPEAQAPQTAPRMTKQTPQIPRHEPCKPCAARSS